MPPDESVGSQMTKMIKMITEMQQFLFVMYPKMWINTMKSCRMVSDDVGQSKIIMMKDFSQFRWWRMSVMKVLSTYLQDNPDLNAFQEGHTSTFCTIKSNLHKTEIKNILPCCLLSWLRQSVWITRQDSDVTSQLACLIFLQCREIDGFSIRKHVSDGRVKAFIRYGPPVLPKILRNL